MKLRVEERVEVIEHPDGATHAKQPLAPVRSDEIRGARNLKAYAPVIRLHGITGRDNVHEVPMED